MNEDLLKIFETVNDWLKHAEAKNAMLAAFNGGAIFSLIQIYEMDLIHNSDFFTYVLFCSILIVLVSLIIVLISFSPQLRFNTESNVAMQKDKNLIYFGYLSKVPGKVIAERIIGDEYSKIKELDRDLAEQIRQNSKVASSKYAHFKIAVWLTNSVLITDLLIAIIFLI